MILVNSSYNTYSPKEFAYSPIITGVLTYSDDALHLTITNNSNDSIYIRTKIHENLKVSLNNKLIRDIYVNRGFGIPYMVDGLKKYCKLR